MTDNPTFRDARTHQKPAKIHRPTTGPGVVVSLSCSSVSLAFAFVKAFWIDSCHDAADFRSEVGTFRRRHSPRSRKRTTSRCSSRSDAYHECGDDEVDRRNPPQEAGAEAAQSLPDPCAFPPPPPPAYPTLDFPASITTRSFGEISAV